MPTPSHRGSLRSPFITTPRTDKSPKVPYPPHLRVPDEASKNDRSEGNVMPCKRQQAPAGEGILPTAKRARLTATAPRRSCSALDLDTAPDFAADDIVSSLSDELLVRILSFLPTSTLLGIAPVSRRFYRLSSDSQLWRTLYYHRFVLPRALRIPGFREGSAKENTRLHFSSRRAVWADGGWGRRGGSGESVDWKRQYKLRHNWARGKATVDELKVGSATLDVSTPERKTLAKVVEGIAVTADGTSGLRAWDLKTREPIAQIRLNDGSDDSIPTCIAIDDRAFDMKTLDVSVGFRDGSFGVWRLHLNEGGFLRRYKHEKSSNGPLVEIAYHHPFLLTATESVLISLYNFERPAGRKSAPSAPSKRVHTAFIEDSETEAGSESSTLRDSESEVEREFLGRIQAPDADKTHRGARDVVPLQAPILLTSLKSHSSRAPLALSIREMASYVIASIAYTYPTREGWSIGIQDLQVRCQGAGGLSTAEIVSTRLAFTNPIKAPSSVWTSPEEPPQQRASPLLTSDGPTTLCYNHPYLLAAMADNTLILHVCTSNATKLSVSPGIRLWGHTSGISDAEITARGKAVSVSSRGEEIRVWELEGRVSGKSIEIRPNSASDNTSQERLDLLSERLSDGWEDRRNWVGFDDEMVIVLKEARDGRESLMVYDFS